MEAGVVLPRLHAYKIISKYIKKPLKGTFYFLLTSDKIKTMNEQEFSIPEGEMGAIDRIHIHGEPTLGELQEELAALRQKQLTPNWTENDRKRFAELQEMETKMQDAA